MNQGQLHKKPQRSKEVKALDFALHPELVCQQSGAVHSWEQLPPHTDAEGRVPPAEVLPAFPHQSSHHLCRSDYIAPSSARVVFQIALGYHVPSIKRAACRAGVSEGSEEAFSLGT